MIGGKMMAVLLREVIDSIAIGGDKALKAPVLAQDVVEKQIARAGGLAVNGIVGADMMDEALPSVMVARKAGR